MGHWTDIPLIIFGLIAGRAGVFLLFTGIWIIRTRGGVYNGRP